MKKVTLVMLAGLCSFAAMAQDSVKSSPKFTIGVHGGAGPASLVGIDRSWNDFQPKAQARVGSMHGLFFQYQILPKMAMCFEVNYESKGWSYASPYLMYFYNEQHRYTYNELHIQEYISLPALMKFKLNASSKRTEWFVKSGINTEFMIRSSVRRGSEQFVYQVGERPNFRLSYVTGFGVNIPVRKTGIISLEVRDTFNPRYFIRYNTDNLLVFLVGFGIKL